ncbi:hypothetical protein KM043_018631 [Ampulex compressa]|nr:hypothetical protein KM043_018631 [Ampulex compressa]
MCGIYCHLSCNHDNTATNLDKWNMCKELITARGPDELTERFEQLTDKWFAHFAASILWTQGDSLVKQPVTDTNGNILLWNGDIYTGSLVDMHQFTDNTNDTSIMYNALQVSPDVVSTLSKVHGPYSFIYYQKADNHLYFGRDIIGRHSLLLQLDNENKSLTLMSVTNKQMKNVIEVPAIGIFVMDLNKSVINLACFPWHSQESKGFDTTIKAMETNLNVDIHIHAPILKSDTLSTNHHLNPSLDDLLYLTSVPPNNDSIEVLKYILGNDKIVKTRVDDLTQLLHKAVQIRIMKQPQACQNCMKLKLQGKEITCNHPKVGILFSGGIDSTILAVLADKYVSQHEPIDLINVAFERPRNAKKKCDKNNEKSDIDYHVPDRHSCRLALKELSKICPNRAWNLIETNVSQEELQKYRSSRIRDLVYPLSTVLDDSLGCAVWFASRAKGMLSETNTVYESPCRIMLLGMGADELFGGYMRHRKILRNEGWAALGQELNNELARISERNLGRDNRVACDHGRVARLPYLDESIVEYVEKLKPWQRCYPTPTMPPGLGDKLLLRLVAWNLKLQCTAVRPKRAFQFGSRIANSKENANDVSWRL